MALKVVVSKAGSTEPVAEHQFGKEARARGISVGSDAENEIVLSGVSSKAGRVERQKTGYYFDQREHRASQDGAAFQQSVHGGIRVVGPGCRCQRMDPDV